MPVSDKSKDLYYGFKYGYADTCRNNSYSGIQQAKKNDVLYVPDPFQVKGSHFTPPYICQGSVLFLLETWVDICMQEKIQQSRM